MPFSPAADSVAVQYTGLTPRELQLLVTSLNGLDYSSIAWEVDLKSMLVNFVSAETESAFFDDEQFGGNLGLRSGNDADVPYEYSDLQEKLLHLKEEQAGFLIGYAEGFWAARSAST